MSAWPFVVCASCRACLIRLLAGVCRRWGGAHHAGVRSPEARAPACGACRRPVPAFRYTRDNESQPPVSPPGLVVDGTLRRSRRRTRRRCRGCALRCDAGAPLARSRCLPEPGGSAPGCRRERRPACAGPGGAGQIPSQGGRPCGGRRSAGLRRIGAGRAGHRERASCAGPRARQSGLCPGQDARSQGAPGVRAVAGPGERRPGGHRQRHQCDRQHAAPSRRLPGRAARVHAQPGHAARARQGQREPVQQHRRRLPRTGRSRRCASLLSRGPSDLPR